MRFKLDEWIKQNGAELSILFVSITAFLIFEDKLVEFSINFWKTYKTLDQVWLRVVYPISIALVTFILWYNEVWKPSVVIILTVSFIYTKLRLFNPSIAFCIVIWPLSYIDILLFCIILISLPKRWFFRKKSASVSELGEGKLYLDDPIETKDKDEYRRHAFACEVTEVIRNLESPENSIAIGVSGAWGSGKTSILNLIKKELRKNDKVQSGFTIVEFSPWQSLSSERIIADFFEVLSKQYPSSKISKQLRQYAKHLLPLEKKLIGVNFFKSFFESNEANINLFDEVKKSIKNDRNKLIIFLDDLDRLESKELITVLRLVRILANFPNVTYIAAYDRSYVTKAVEKEITDHQPEVYIDKIFNIDFKIPELGKIIVSDKFRKYLMAQKDYVNGFFTTANIDAINVINQEDFFYRIVGQPRDIKRFANIFLIRLKAFHENEIEKLENIFQIEIFYLLELLNYKNPELYLYAYENFGIESARSKDAKFYNDLLNKLNQFIIQYQIKELTDYHYYFKLSDELNFTPEFVNTLVTRTKEKIKEDIIPYLKRNKTNVISRIDNFYPITDPVSVFGLITLFNALYDLSGENIETFDQNDFYNSLGFLSHLLGAEFDTANEVLTFQINILVFISKYISKNEKISSLDDDQKLQNLAQLLFSVPFQNFEIAKNHIELILNEESIINKIISTGKFPNVRWLIQEKMLQNLASLVNSQNGQIQLVDAFDSYKDIFNFFFDNEYQGKSSSHMVLLKRLVDEHLSRQIAKGVNVNGLNQMIVTSGDYRAQVSFNDYRGLVLRLISGTQAKVIDIETLPNPRHNAHGYTVTHSLHYYVTDGKKMAVQIFS